MNQEQFAKQLASNPRPVVVDFWAPWCAPCRAIEPALKALGQTYEGKVDVLSLNADEHSDLLQALGVYSIPTLVTFREGREITRRSGAASQAVLDGLFQAGLSGKEPVSAGITPTDRLVRLAVGMGLFGMGLVNLLSLGGSGLVSWGMMLLGLALGFSGVYDRCPVYRAIRGWVHSQIRSG